MELIDQHTKTIMEGCKERAKAAGLSFQDESLEYIVTNRDLIELTPKVMIPTLYDYWVQDVEVLKEKGRYELYPGNPYETVINTRPAISFYNDNNPDWLNVMIFYHVLAHIDFFQNNLYFRNTWDYDFNGQALSDKRMIASLRARKGRWVDYIIEFSRGIDNLVGYHDELMRLHQPATDGRSRMLDFYFDVFLQQQKKVRMGEYIKEIERYNSCTREFAKGAEETFFAEVIAKYPEFENLYQKSLNQKKKQKPDLLRFLMEESKFLNREENRWMIPVIEVIRKTSLFFQPQIRTKIMNEGWASFWHEVLFLQDDRINGHEVDFARVNAWVTSLPRVGLNPYALGLRLFNHLEEMGNKGRHSFEFQRLADTAARKKFDLAEGLGREFIFEVRENFCDFSFINTFVDQDFVNANKLFVAGKRMNPQRMTWQYYVKSRKAEDYKDMLLAQLYHPPAMSISVTEGGALYLNHRFEEKPLVKDFIHNTMLGIEYLWGAPVQLETSEPVVSGKPRESLPGYPAGRKDEEEQKPQIEWHRYLYTVEDRKLSRKELT